MSRYSDEYTAMAPWRKYLTIVLTIVAFALLVLAITGAAPAWFGLAVFAIILLSLGLGPRSPFFKKG